MNNETDNGAVVTLTAAELYALLDQARRAASAAEFALQVQVNPLTKDDHVAYFRSCNHHGNEEAKMKAMLDEAFSGKD